MAAIEKSSGRPLNTVVPNRFASLKLPPLKMKGVDVAELFQALEAASNSHEQSPQGVFTDKFGFRTQGAASDSSIWYFFVDGPPSPPRVSRFYLLTPFLDRGLTVDDITTAIQTSWRMLGISAPPELSFHKDTQLLIGVGDQYQLQTIDDVLRALSARTPPVSPKPDAPRTK